MTISGRLTINKSLSAWEPRSSFPFYSSHEWGILLNKINTIRARWNRCGKVSSSVSTINARLFVWLSSSGLLANRRSFKRGWMETSRWYRCVSNTRGVIYSKIWLKNQPLVETLVKIAQVKLLQVKSTYNWLKNEFWWENDNWDLQVFVKNRQSR